jgi:N6-adenosine-specific RNA methylase IME4
MKKYKAILADPPWCYRDTQNARKRGAAHKYDVMSNTDIQALNVKSIAARHDGGLGLHVQNRGVHLDQAHKA